MIVSIDTERLEKGDLSELRKLFEIGLEVVNNGIQLSLLPADTALDEEPFDRYEPLPDGVSRPDGQTGPDGKSRRWMTIPEAAPILGRPEAYIYKHWKRLRLARKAGGCVYVDAIRLPSLIALLKHL